MEKIKAYIRNNTVFVGLLSVIVFIILGLGMYYVTQMNLATPPPIDNEEEPEPTTTTNIASFESTYTRNNQVVVSWNVVQGEDLVTSINLYHGDTWIADVSGSSSYTMLESVYLFPTGDNEFSLRVQTQSGGSLEAKTTVFINYIIAIEMSSEISEQGVLIKAKYKYNSARPVGVPRIATHFKGDNISQAFTYSYIDTQRSQNGEIVEAETSHLITTNQVVNGTYMMNIRWIFEGNNISYDFPLTIVVAH